MTITAKDTSPEAASKRRALYRDTDRQLAALLIEKGHLVEKDQSWIGDSVECITLMANFKLTPIWSDNSDIVSFVVGEEVVCESFEDHMSKNAAFKYCLVRAAIKLLESQKDKDEQQSKPS